MAGVIIAFTLLPGLSLAGSLEPPSTAVDPYGNPVLTMKTLDDLNYMLEHIPPTWNKKLADSEQFEVLDDHFGYLDKETGLVWDVGTELVTRNWFEAQWFCASQGWRGRRGWRLPTIYELSSALTYTDGRWAS